MCLLCVCIHVYVIACIFVYVIVCVYVHVCMCVMHMYNIYLQCVIIDCEEYDETVPLNCDDRFGLTSDGYICLPLCEEFSQYSEAYTTPHLVLSATSSSLVVIGGIIVIAMSFKKRKIM